MSPRTNDGEREQPGQPDAGRPAPQARRPEPATGRPASEPEARRATSGDDAPGTGATGSGTATEAEARDAVGPAEARTSDEPARPAEPQTEARLSDEPALPAEPVPDAGDERVAAVRRVGAAGRRWRAVHLGACAAMLAVALTAGAVALGAVHEQRGLPVAAAAAVSPGLLAGGDLDASITALQTHLRAQPHDFGGWATLGLAYVEQARTKGDPSRYPQAEQALKRSLALRADNDQALAGRAALAAARHDFAGALSFADRTLKQNPYNERALSSRIDALVELGRYDDADAAARTADQRRPGVPVFTRYAYVHELRGDVTTARRVLERALAASSSPGDIAYVGAQLGQLAWNQGDYATALTHYARALAADENYLPALEGRARAQAASGRQAEAIKGLELIVARYPLPGPLVELGELYEARGGAGDAAKAADQYALVDAWTAIARANGVNADLDTALAAADHGDRATALRAARDDWSRRHTVHTADALAWALHVNGKDAEALPYARQATATGYRNASFLYHLGVIEKATGRPQDARAHLSAALKLNPGFSVLGAREARTALKSLEATK
ncbi:tetratricopeptide repeat protein [Streptomyces sp. FL07-04A]|uniref:tetratricopeptide repeat protein n=1 Tax=Streptomyces sp. FL07-04A TaxID=3028658 RepID=UPI0029A3E7EF|nr:tetratricopeptide repeat protein [Streptomyces sp. FL07-04A]MDX3578169.1 tetratricopeptide repeat protein [Streptomyces sp. FL07-04A]